MNTENLKGLNEKQKEAVQYTEGPLLILAGAGSGKTRVLTHRIGYLLENGLARPWQILAITFTNKAAGEMRERVDRLLPGSGESVFVSTFHSMCVRMLRRDIDRLGYSRDFSIYDTDDQRTLMRQVLKDLQMDPKQYRERGMLSAISSMKNELTGPEEAENQASDFYERNLAKIYREYENRLHKNNALDFDDLLLKTVDLFDEFPEVLESWQNRFVYIMVDEYQDTNTVQFELVRMLSAKHRNLCVVGDDDQSIYKFRGADIGNILNFEKSFPGSKVVRLEQNYRSTKAILRAANEVIRNNKGRKPKTLWTENEQGELPAFNEYDTAAEEAERTIQAVKSSRFPVSAQAVLYRTNAQSRLLEEKCIAYDVPYVLVGGVNFYQRKEIKDVLSYLRIIANGVDELSCDRIINVPKRGIGETTIGRVREYARSFGMNFYDALCLAREIPGLSRGTVGKLESFTDLIEGFRRRLKKGELSLRGIIEAVRDETGYGEELKKEDPVTAQSRLENLEELISKAVDFEGKDELLEVQAAQETEKTSGDTAEKDRPEETAGTSMETDEIERLARFLEEVSLVADIDRTENREECLKLMTLHGAKGLEFDKVYLCGMEEGLFPSYSCIMAENPEEEVEEERRLCYVGMTRARKELVMSSARERMLNGETRHQAPSRFVEELPKDGVVLNCRKKRAASWDDSFRERIPGNGFGRTYGSLQYSRELSGVKPAPVSKNDNFRKGAAIEKKKPAYETGDRVRHIKFGEGTVLKIEEDTKDFKVTVQFAGGETKVMFAGFAKLEKV